MSQLRSLACLLAILSAGVSASIGPSAVLPIVNKKIAPDGFLRQTTLAGGDHPGPVIRGQKNAEFTIKVINMLFDNTLDLTTSIHWHGLFQKNANYEDGVESITQCPLVPNESFTYDFKALDQAGTFWYHSHFGDQYCDGLRGAFIVEDPNDPHKGLYDVDNDDTVISLSDWYHYLSTSPPAIPAFNSTLINGKGRYVGGPQNVPLAVVSVTQGTRYRFRLLSISCDPSFVFSIDGHQFTVIEVEGTNVQPLVVDSVELFAGQRCSVVFNADQPIGNYWIRALPHVSTWILDFSDHTNVAILRYSSAPIEDPSADPNVNVPVSQLPLVETNLHVSCLFPLDLLSPGLSQPGGADININLDVGFDQTSLPNGFQYSINGFLYKPPTVPVLLQILSGAKKASDLLPLGSIYGLDANKSVEITIPGGSTGGPHPIHLHGHNFWVVRSAGNSSYNFVDPIVRDVVSIGDSTDNVTIRFFTDNPGPWFFHCHINWHLTKSALCLVASPVVFAEDVPDTPTAFSITSKLFPSLRFPVTHSGWSCLAAWKDLCPVFNTWANITGS
ncbi:laccase [Lactarius psammicola]|nr:laccase [Lactarius psammicola]